MTLIYMRDTVNWRLRTIGTEDRQCRQIKIAMLPQNCLGQDKCVFLKAAMIMQERKLA